MWSKTSTIADKVGNFLESGIRLLNILLRITDIRWIWARPRWPGEGWQIPSCRSQSPVTGDGAGAADEAHTAGARSGRSRSQRVTPVTVRLQTQWDHNRETGYEWHIVNNSRLGIKTDHLQSSSVSWAVNQPAREYMRLNELTTRRFGLRAFEADLCWFEFHSVVLKSSR